VQCESGPRILQWDARQRLLGRRDRPGPECAERGVAKPVPARNVAPFVLSERRMHAPLDSIDSLLARGAVWSLARRAPWMFPGGTLHRAGLRALDRGAYQTADALLEHAALRYRADLRTIPLARVRVHPRMARARAAGSGAGAEELRLEVEHSLRGLDRIESPTAPHDLVDARSLLATWLTGEDGPAEPSLERHAA
jgi:hypothetical protein